MQGWSEIARGVTHWVHPGSSAISEGWGDYLVSRDQSAMGLSIEYSHRHTGAGALLVRTSLTKVESSRRVEWSLLHRSGGGIYTDHTLPALGEHRAKVYTDDSQLEEFFKNVERATREYLDV